MSIEKASALVVRGTDWSETSRIVTLFSREHGKIRALAKGGRRLKSNFEVALDLLNLCEVVYIRKATDGLDLLTEARVAERFPALRADLQALYAGYYIAELLADGTHEYDPHPALFDIASATLRGLGERHADRFLAVSRFELAWLRELGYSPRLEACAACERDLTGLADVARLGYSPVAGGVLCPDCSRGMRDHRPISRAAWEAIRELEPVGEREAGSSPALPEVRQILGQTVGYVLGRRPRLLGYVDG